MPEVHVDATNSPGLRRIESLTEHLWAASGVPMEAQLYTILSNDGTPINRGCSMPVEASTITVANLELHNPTVASENKHTKEESEALW